MPERTNSFLKKLAKAREEHANAVLIAPKDPTAFEYGRVSGFYQGLVAAESLINEVLAEEANERKRFEST